MIMLDLAMTLRNFTYHKDKGENMIYVYPDGLSLGTEAVKKAAQYYLLFNQLVPLALVVVGELSKLLYSPLMEKDHEMISIRDGEMIKLRV